MCIFFFMNESSAMSHDKKQQHYFQLAAKSYSKNDFQTAEETLKVFFKNNSPNKEEESKVFLGLRDFHDYLCNMYRQNNYSDDQIHKYLYQVFFDLFNDFPDITSLKYGLFLE